MTNGRLRPPVFLSRQWFPGALAPYPSTGPTTPHLGRMRVGCDGLEGR